MAAGLGKLTNDYARYVDNAGIDAPKAVWMAIAMSLANQVSGGCLDRNIIPSDTLMAEWQALYDNGIVPQKPRKTR